MTKKRMAWLLILAAMAGCGDRQNTASGNWATEGKEGDFVFRAQIELRENKAGDISGSGLIELESQVACFTVEGGRIGNTVTLSIILPDSYDDFDSGFDGFLMADSLRGMLTIKHFNIKEHVVWTR